MELPEVDSNYLFSYWKNTLSRSERYYMPKDLLERAKVSEEKVFKPVFKIVVDALTMKIMTESRTKPATEDLELYAEPIQPPIPDDFSEKVVEFPIQGSESIVVCQECGGAGELICPSCRGTGELVCSRCRGEGYITSYVGEEVVETECPNCGGSGTVTCTRCRGAGTLICSACDGSGKVWRYAVKIFSFKHHHLDDVILEDDIGFMKKYTGKLPREAWVNVDPKDVEAMASKYVSARMVQSTLKSFFREIENYGKIVKHEETFRYTPGLLLEVEYDGSKFKLGSVGTKEKMIIRSFGMPLDKTKVKIYYMSRAIAAVFLILLVVTFIAKILNIASLAMLVNLSGIFGPYYYFLLMLLILGILPLVLVPGLPER